MPTFDAGTASIRVKPSFLTFVTETETALRAMDFHVDARVDAETNTAATEIANLRRAASGNLTIRVDANTRVAAAELAGLRAANRDLTIGVRTDARSESRARADLSRLTAKLASAAKINLAVVGVVGAAGAVADLLAIAGAASKAANAVGLIPAIGFGGLTGIAGLVTGFSGVPAAFKAMTAASKDSADAARDQRDALEGIAEAEFRVTQSQSNLSEAYKDSTRSIRDMNSSLADQRLATQDAALSVQEAAQRLQKVQFDPTADALQRARAKLTYDQAVQRLQEQQTKTQDLAADTAEANAKGVEGSKQVIDAKHAELRALQDLRKAQEELAKPSTGQAKLDDALGKLSPNARQLVTDIRALGPAWTDTRKAAQDALTEGMGPAITGLANTQLPTLREGLVGVNAAINTGIKASIASLSSEVNRVDFKKSLDNTTLGFANAAKGAGPLTDALTKLITVGSEFLPRLGDAIADAANRFNALIQRTAADGSLKQWIEDGIQTTKQLLRIIGDVGSAIASVFRAAGGNGAALTSLEGMTDRMAKFLKSTEGQQQMKVFFAEARDRFDQVKGILEDLPEILGGVMDGFQAWSAVLMPFLNAAAALLSAHPGLVGLAVTAYLGFKTLSPIFSAVRVGIDAGTAAVDRFRTASANAATNGAGRLQGTARGLVAMLGAGGIFTLAVAGATTALFFLTQRHQEAARAAEEQRQKLDALQATLDKGTGRVTRETLEAAGKELQAGGFFTRAESFGIGPQTFLRAATGLADADKAAINAQLTQAIEQSLARDTIFSGFQSKGFASAGLSSTDVAQALQGVPEAVAKYSEAVKKFNDALGPGKQEQALPDLGKLKGQIDDVGESAATLGGKLNGYSSEVGTAGAKQRELNQAMNGTFALTEDARNRFAQLGIAVQSVPDAKTISIKDTTPENIKRLQDLGYTVQHLPDGTLVIVADDSRARADITAITTAPYKANVEVNFTFPQSLSVETLKKLHENIDNVPIAPSLRAAGGDISGGTPGRDSVPALLMPGEHVLTAADVAAMGGQAEVYKFRAGLHQYAEGGAVGQPPVVASMAQLVAARFPGMQLTSGLRFTDRGYHSRGQAADFSDGEDSTPGMQQLAAYIASSFPQSLELIHSPFAHNIKDGRDVGAGPPVYDAKTMSEHRSHVHWAMATPPVPSAAGAGPFSTAPGTLGTTNPSTLTTQSQIYPQAPLPGRASEAQLQVLSGKAAVDAANSERNAVYANPASTAQDRLAADIKYQQAQNSLEAAQKSSDTSSLSLQGIFSKAGSILATGLLSAVGLENSIFSDTNVYNRSANSLATGLAQRNQPGGYAYQPQNLPSILTTSTPQSPGAANDPSLSGQIPGSGPVTGGLAVDPNLGTTGVNVVVPGAAPAASAGGKSGPVVERVRSVMSDVGWHVGTQWDSLYQLVDHESSWNPTAQNPTSTAYGLFQFLDTTWATVGGVKTSDPGLQALYGRKYIKQRYGDPSRAWTFWQQQSPHWYADGGWVHGVGGSRGDGIHARVSPGEYVVNAAAAARYGPVLEAINASTWSPVRMDAPAISTPSTSAAGHNFSTTIVEPRVADVGDLIALAERAAQTKAIGLMAAMI